VDLLYSISNPHGFKSSGDHTSSMERRVVTFSRNVFIPLTTVCRNRCGYCSFRTPVSPGAILSQPHNA
jgi:2-iminoacetate synthase ThiH